VNHYSFLWEKRQQDPKDHGTADISVVLTINLQQEEIASIVMDPQEYSDTMWIDPQIIVEQAHASITFHPALRQAVIDLLCMRKWFYLESILAMECNDKEIRTALNDFLQLKRLQ